MSDQISDDENSQFTEFLASNREVIDLLQRVWGNPTESGGVTDNVIGLETPRLDDQATVGGGGPNHRPQPSPTSQDQWPAQIGRFEIKRMLGQGGFGIVLLAYDPQLKRDVALKIQRPEAVLTEELRARFVREAETAAALNHANIVPVFEAGSYGPICYIASAYCSGQSLAEWVAKSSSLPTCRQAAEMVALLADAVSHAHSRGVIHRDLKPENILLDEQKTHADCQSEGPGQPRSELPFPRITDFGLAKLIDDNSNITRSGAVLGTPAYIAPEQIATAGGAAGATADIYSLGAILFFLLTGRAPFMAPTLLATIRAVQDELPPSPRKFRKGIPQDLEAICLKCLEKLPGKRYLSASQLQSDLLRFLDGLPVSARRTSQLDRVRIWCRRNPALAVTLTGLILALAGGTITGFTLWGRSESMRKLANARGDDLADEVRAKESALHNLQISQANVQLKSSQLTSAIEELFNSIADSPEVRIPEAEPLRRKILQRAENVYSVILDNSPSEPLIVAEHAKSVFQLARLNEELGDSSRALELVDRAIASAESAVSEIPDLQTALGVWSVRRGKILTNLGRFNDARPAFEEGLSYLPENSKDLEIRYLRADCMGIQMLNMLAAGRFADAALVADRLVPDWKFLASHFHRPEDAEVQLARGRFQWVLGQVYDANGDLENSELALCQGIEVLQAIDRKYLSNPLQVTYRIAHCRHRLGVAMAQRQDLVSAQVQYQHAVQSFEELVEAFPDIEEYSSVLGDTRYSLAVTEFFLKNYTVAEQLLMTNVADNLRLIELYPDQAFIYWEKIGKFYNVIAAAREKINPDDYESRFQAVTASADAHQQAAALKPDYHQLKLGIVYSLGMQSGLYLDQDEFELALETLDVAVEVAEKLVNEKPEWTEARGSLRGIYERFANVHDRLGQPESTIKYCRDALELDGLRPALSLNMLLAKSHVLLRQHEDASREFASIGDHLDRPEQHIDAAEQLATFFQEGVDDPELTFAEQALQFLNWGRPDDPAELSAYCESISKRQQLMKLPEVQEWVQSQCP